MRDRFATRNRASVSRDHVRVLAQQEPQVGFWSRGTFTRPAVIKHFGSSVRACRWPRSTKCLHEVEGGHRRFRRGTHETPARDGQSHPHMFLSSSASRSAARWNSHPPCLMANGRTAAIKTRWCAHPPGLGAVPRLAGRSMPDVEGWPPRAMRKARAGHATRAHRGNCQPRCGGDLRPEPGSPRRSKTGRTIRTRFSWWPQLFSSSGTRPAIGVGERHRRCRRAVQLLEPCLNTGEHEPRIPSHGLRNRRSGTNVSSSISRAT